MTTLSFYLLFDGNCAQAMGFYQTCFGGELRLTRVADSAMKPYLPADTHHKIINAQLINGSMTISASDWLRPDRTPQPGNTVCLYLQGGSFATLAEFFTKLSEGAALIDPLTEHFSGSYGALTDRFGIRWMFQTEQKA